MSQPNPEDLMASGKVYQCDDEECYCGARPPLGLKLCLAPCWRVGCQKSKNAKSTSMGVIAFCGENHYIYVCRTCQKTYTKEEIWFRHKVFIVKSKPKTKVIA